MPRSTNQSPENEMDIAPSTPIAPIDYEFEGRLRKAGDVANVLANLGWEPTITLTDEMWQKAVMVTGRKASRKGGKEVWISDQCKALVLKLLEERWKERAG